MKLSSTEQKIAATLLAGSVLLLPMIAAAHGGVDDGDGGVVDPDGHHAGASALMKAGSPAWLGLLFVSIALMSALSYGVWKFLQVAPPKKAAPATKETPK